MGCNGPGTVEEFFCGYRDRAAGDVRLLQLEPLVYVNVQCESRWLLAPPPNGFHGLNQFTTGTWLANARAGADPYDAYEQGWATANLISKIDPRSTEGWPSCFPG